MRVPITMCGAFTLLLCLSIGNFGYEFAHAENYLRALERTYFQMWALLLAWFVWRGEPA